MKNIIALFGKAGIGKTTCLHKLGDILTNNGYTPTRLDDQKTKSDFVSIYKKDSFIVAIGSQGDNDGCADNNITTLKNNGLFDKINCYVCATRTKGGSCNVIKRINVDIIWIGKSYCKFIKRNELQEEIINHAQAEMIYNIIASIKSSKFS